MAELGINFRHDPAHQRKAALAKHAQSGQTAIAQAIALQLALFNAGETMGKDVANCEDKAERARAAQVLAGVCKGWQSIQDQIRILKGTPLPGSLRPSEKPKGKRKADSLSPLTSPLSPPSKESISPE